MIMQSSEKNPVTWGHGGVGGTRVAKPLDPRGSIFERSIRKLTVKYSGHTDSYLRPGSTASAAVRAKGPSLLGRHILPPIKKEESK